MSEYFYLLIVESVSKDLNPFRRCRLASGKGIRPAAGRLNAGLCKKSLRLVPLVPHGFRKGCSAVRLSAPPTALLDEKGTGGG
jgi:hypothetical protein